MSVVINDEPFEIYSYDTIESIVERYSIYSIYGIDPDLSLPKYRKCTTLHEPVSIIEKQIINTIEVDYVSERHYSINPLEGYIFKIESIYDVIKRSNEINLFEESKFEASIKQLYENVQKIFDNVKDQEECVFLYLILQESVIQKIKGDEEYESNEDSYNYIKNNVELFNLSKYIQNRPTKYKQFYETYQKELNAVRNRVNRLRENYDKLSILKQYDMSQLPNSFVSPIKETQIRYDGEFELQVDIYELLNLIVPDRNFPFLKIAKFYKILNNFIVPLQWLEENDEGNETLRLYIQKIGLKWNRILNNQKLKIILQLKLINFLKHHILHFNINMQ